MNYENSTKLSELETSSALKSLVISLGADVCGIGSIDHFSEAPAGFSPADLYENCHSVIAFGIALPKGLYEVEPRLIYGHFNDGICRCIDDIAFNTAKKIETLYGGIGVPVPCDAPNEYWDAEHLTAKGLISMKHTAVLCGLGQLGKSTLLLNPQFGNRLVVGAVLTDLKLISDPLCRNICIPGCTYCIDSCPVHAIHDGHVDQSLCRTNSYGKTGRGFDTVDCNRCRRVCPNRNCELHK